jgi:hypothetical protein
VQLLEYAEDLPRCQYPGHLRVGTPVNVKDASERSISLVSTYGGMRL